MDRLFTVLIKDYEAGTEPDELTAQAVEFAVKHYVLDSNDSDGIVVVNEQKMSNPSPTSGRKR